MRVGSDRPRDWLRVFVGVVLAWVLLGGLIVLEIVPYTPRTSRGWALFLLAGPPLYVALLWFGERLVGPRLARISPARFSFTWFAWMALVVVVGFSLVAVSALVALRFGP